VSSAALAFPQKSAEAFRTISEVAIELDVPQHVLRFWESRFAQIRPVKRAGGRRYYRPEDIDLLKGIRALLYNDGFTIKGVQKVLKERGLRHVADVGRGGIGFAAPVAPVMPQVIEKIVYVEKPAPAPVKKPRPTHLRAVPAAFSLPFFDEPQAPAVAIAPEPKPEVQVAPVVTHEPVPDSPVAEHRERLEELLDELTGLKARLQAARERIS
jgi:DNA-binding transcriptional MerR regulator